MKNGSISVVALGLFIAGIALAKTHANHGAHVHGEDCGHTRVQHDGHTDYLHDGHMHHFDGKQTVDHSLAVDAAHPNKCAETKTGHDAKHKHGVACGHEAVPHGDHTDYLVDGTVHHAHGGHCDDHGKLTAGM